MDVAGEFAGRLERRLRSLRRNERFSGVLAPLEARVGRLDHRLRDRMEQRSPVLDTRHIMEHRPDSGETPIFVLGTGWRSGSTLVQRLACSTEEALVWGEPWHRCALVPHLRESMQVISSRWPTRSVGLDDLQPRRVSEQWIANLFPDLSDLIRAHQRLFIDWLATPAREAGFGRWGMKTVRLDGQDVRYLRLLFPDARIVAVHRDPRQAWVSYRASGFRSYQRYPSTPVRTVNQFARVWRTLATSITGVASECDVFVVPYDSLTGESGIVDELSSVLGIDIDRSVLSRRVGGSQGKPTLSRREQRVIDRVAGETMGALGYV